MADKQGRVRYYKVLNADGSCFHGGTGRWFLPSGKKPGKWVPEIEHLKFCQSGYHILKAEHLFDWFGPACFVVEPKGEVLADTNKCLCRSARLLRRIKGWNERTLRLFAADCAERVLPIFEKKYPKDNRPRLAIKAARDFANGKIDASACAAADVAAYAATDASTDAAACAAADVAARAAAYAATDASACAAADAAAYAAADVAARAAAYAAERKWQINHLLKMIGESE